MRPRDRARLRFVAWACLIAVLIAAASPVSAGLPQAILAPAGPVLSEPAAVSVRLRAPKRPLRPIGSYSGPSPLAPRPLA